jgi:Spy/CpxP family protein refolding chaperone
MRLLAAGKALVVGVLLVGLSGPGGSLAQRPGPARGPGPGPGPQPGRFVERHAERLGLDEETQAALQEIVDEARKRGEELEIELRDAHEQMRDLLSQEEPDESAVMRQAEAIGELELEERKNRLRATLRIRALLTPEQREELIRIREESGPRGVRRLGASCQTDIEKICRDEQPGRETIRCLREKRDVISEDCRSALESMRGRGFGRRR